MTRRSVHRKGTPEKICRENGIMHIMEENKVIKTKNHISTCSWQHTDHPHDTIKSELATTPREKVKRPPTSQKSIKAPWHKQVNVLGKGLGTCLLCGLAQALSWHKLCPLMLACTSTLALFSWSSFVSCIVGGQKQACLSGWGTGLGWAVACFAHSWGCYRCTCVMNFHPSQQQKKHKVSLMHLPKGKSEV